MGDESSRGMAELLFRDQPIFRDDLRTRSDAASAVSVREEGAEQPASVTSTAQIITRNEQDSKTRESVERQGGHRLAAAQPPCLTDSEG
jgi:hypothetical protein